MSSTLEEVLTCNGSYPATLPYLHPEIQSPN
jgi:hypothetical protein